MSTSNNGHVEWMAERLAHLRRLQEHEAEADPAERRADLRDRLRRDRVLRITQNIWPDTEGDAFIRDLRARTTSSTSTPFGPSPAPGEFDGEGQPAPPLAPGKAPQGARDGLPERATGDDWLRALAHEALGGRGWTSAHAEPRS